MLNIYLHIQIFLFETIPQGAVYYKFRYICVAVQSMNGLHI